MICSQRPHARIIASEFANVTSMADTLSPRSSHSECRFLSQRNMGTSRLRLYLGSWTGQYQLIFSGCGAVTASVDRSNHPHTQNGILGHQTHRRRAGLRAPRLRSIGAGKFGALTQSTQATIREISGALLHRRESGSVALLSTVDRKTWVTTVTSIRPSRSQRPFAAELKTFQ